VGHIAIIFQSPDLPDCEDYCGDLLERALSSPTLRELQVRKFPTHNKKPPTPGPLITRRSGVRVPPGGHYLRR
jgi:hypothetical protein